MSGTAMTHAAVTTPLSAGPTRPPPMPPDELLLGPISPLVVVTGRLAVLPARVTEPRCGTVVVPDGGRGLANAAAGRGHRSSLQDLDLAAGRGRGPGRTAAGGQHRAA